MFFVKSAPFLIVVLCTLLFFNAVIVTLHMQQINAMKESFIQSAKMTTIMLSSVQSFFKELRDKPRCSTATITKSEFRDLLFSKADTKGGTKREEEATNSILNALNSARKSDTVTVNIDRDGQKDQK